MIKRVMPCILALSAILAFSLVSCKTNDDDDKGKDEKVSTSDVDFESHSDYSVMVKNNTSFKLIAFKGSPSKANLIGGIPSNATAHKLNRSEALFNASQDFMLFVIKESDYIENKDNLSALENKPFANVYAYYNKSADNQMVYEISSRLGGQGTITMYNTSGFNIELRLNGINGPTLGYIGDGMTVTTFKVAYNDNDFEEYLVYPVFRKFNAARNEIMTVYPKYGSTAGKAAGKAVCERFELSANGDTSKQLRSSEWLGNGLEMSSGYAYIQVTNGNKQAVNFLDGGVAQITSTGGKLINSNRTMTFQIAMPESPNSTPGSREYLSKIDATDNSYAIGTPAVSEPIPGRTYKADYLYSVTLGGDTIYDISISDVKVVGKYDFANNKFIEIDTDADVSSL